jgi:DNA helicase HerA-like ATPase
MAEFLFPREGYHTAILGTTGSGKSTLGAWLLSKAPFHLKPAFIIDFKHEEIFQKCLRIREIGIHESLPSHAGLYVVRPRPDEAFRADGGPDVEKWLEKLWRNGNAWLFIDEGYLMPDKAWLRNVLAQGRSLGITVVTCSQRPVDVPLSIFTEATYISIFHLNFKKDKQRVEEYTIEGLSESRLPDYHSYWYDRSQHKATDPKPYVVLSPVPGAEQIVEVIDSRLRPRHSIL